MSDRDTLLSMGFSDTRADKALKATKNAGLGQALDFLEKHADESETWWAAKEDDDEDDEGAPTGVDDPEAKSLRCGECGKLFRNQALASYHSTKSGHTNFEESTEELKPLTEEEKAEKLRELRAKMDEKKKLQAKQDAEEARRNEEIRRKSGKDEAQAREALKLKEAERAAMLRKKEKADELAARARIKEQIEADKRARAEKAAREKALREGRNPDAAAAATAPPVPVVPAGVGASGEKKAAPTYDSARLQIRVPSGPPLVHSLPATSTLGDVAEWVKAQTGMASVSLTCSFPRKTYGDADLGKDLKALGLVPSAVLIVQ
ncbi:ubiquitin-related domain-containing protein [Rhodotorula diobovata]|uniref:Ubiquitin-related domain-containing protein n=1 Tax=Rhodotorula diobovata TaxID=5288 RepID=A0A5C5G4P8_9BASI|nr:ubiquitin-related domain-containing protein [Rhodotorula diobovata]